MAVNTAEILIDECRRASGTVGLIEFDGVSSTKYDALVKEVAALFRTSNLDQLVRCSRQAAVHMLEMGLFEACQPKINLIDREKDSYSVRFTVQEHKHPVKLNVKMEMRSTGEMDAGLGARRMNIFGRGESAELTYVKGLRTGSGYNYGFSGVKPFLGWKRYDSLAVNIFKNNEYLKWNKSDLTENAAIFHLRTAHFHNKITSSLRLNLIWRLFTPRNDTPFLIREFAGHTTRISMEHTLSADSRDRPILPSSGSLYRMTTEYAGLLGDSSFIKHVFDYQTARTLPLYGLILSGSFRLAFMQSIGKRSVHLLDRIYLGGPYDIRGFESSSLGLRAENCSFGGNASLSSALHLYFPLFPKDMLFAHLFLTAGSISPMRSKKRLSDLFGAQRVTTGFGLAMNFMDSARLELNFVVPLRILSGDNCPCGIQVAAGINFM